jgi:hypothetical protein
LDIQHSGLWYYLQVSELTKRLAASIQAAYEGLDIIMDALVRL